MGSVDQPRGKCGLSTRETKERTGKGGRARTVPSSDNERDSFRFVVDGRFRRFPHEDGRYLGRLGPSFDVVVHFVDLGFDRVQFGHDRFERGTAKVRFERLDKLVFVVLLKKKTHSPEFEPKRKDTGERKTDERRGTRVA